MKLFQFYIKSDIHVSMAAASLVCITSYYYGDSIDYHDVFFVFFSTLFSYNFIRVFEGERCYVCFRAIFKKQANYVLYLLIIALAGTFYYASSLDWRDYLILFPAFLLTLAYVFPIVKYRNQWVSFRDYPNLKLVSIAVSWAIVSVLFPLSHHLNDVGVWYLFVQRLFLVIALAIPFDIRDLNKDAVNLRTLPQQIGVTKTIALGIGSLLVFIVLTFIYKHYDGTTLLSDGLVFLVTLVFLIFSKPGQSKYYASFWVESIPVFWLIFLWTILSLVK